MPHDLFTPAARENICRYFAATSRDSLSVLVDSNFEGTDKYGYAFRFVANREKPGEQWITDARVWNSLVSAVLKCFGSLGTPEYNLISDIICFEQAVEGKPSITFIEPFFTDLGRKLLCEHHHVAAWKGPKSSEPRDSDLWVNFLGMIARANTFHDAHDLAQFLAGPYEAIK